MKLIYMLVAALVAVATPSIASAQSLGEEGSWQFRTPAERSVALGVAQTIEAKKAGAFENGGFGGSGTGFGAGGSAANTNNFFQYVDQSQVTNTCSSSGSVGSTLTCGGGGGTSISGTSQVSSGNSNSSKAEIRDNTVTSSDNTTNNTQNRGNNNTNNTTNGGN